MEARFDVVVAGGGVAGLVAGAVAARGGARTLVLDAHGAGGRARIVTRDGFTLNNGPHALYLNAALHRTLHEFDVAVPGGVPSSSGAMGARNATLSPLPAGPSTLARTKLLGARSKVRVARLLAQLPKLDPSRLVGRPVDDWLADEPDDVAALIRMLVRVSTYVDAPEALDAGAAVGQLQLTLADGVRYLDGGWQVIVDGLVAAVQRHGGELRAATQVTKVQGDAGEVELTTNDGLVRATVAVVAVGGPNETAQVLGLPSGALLASTPGTRSSGALLPASGPVRVSVLDLGLRRAPTHPVVFGVDRPTYVSTHAPVARLAPDGATLVGVMRYLPPGTADIATRDELWAQAAEAGIEARDVVMERYLRQVTVAHGFPTASGGGLAGRPTSTAADIEGVFVAGDWVGPVGLLADASAASGRRAAELALARWTTVVV